MAVCMCVCVYVSVLPNVVNIYTCFRSKNGPTNFDPPSCAPFPSSWKSFKYWNVNQIELRFFSANIYPCDLKLRVWTTHSWCRTLRRPKATHDMHSLFILFLFSCSIWETWVFVVGRIEHQKKNAVRTHWHRKCTNRTI